MAKMHRAIAVPKTVAQLTMVEDVGSPFLVSMLRPAAPAIACALWICSAVNGWAASANHAIGDPMTAREILRSWTACSVTSMSGAWIPVGSAARYWITGCVSPPFLVQLRLCIEFPLFVPPAGASFSQKANSTPETPAKPGREVTTSAFGAICDWRMPRTRSNCGEATGGQWLVDFDPVLFWRLPTK